MASNISSSSGTKLVKSSQTLQIIQSRLAIKQQLYTDALLRKQQQQVSVSTSMNGLAEAPDVSTDEPRSPITQEDNDDYDDDNESFVSADSVGHHGFCVFSASGFSFSCGFRLSTGRGLAERGDATQYRPRRRE